MARGSNAYQAELRQWDYRLLPEHIAPVFVEKLAVECIKSIIDMWVTLNGTGSISTSPGGANYEIEGFTALLAFTNKRVDDYRKLIMKAQMRYFKVQWSHHLVESLSSVQQTFEPGPGMPVFSTLMGHFSTHYPCSRKGETALMLIPTEIAETFGSIVLLFNSPSPDGGLSQSAHVVTGLSPNTTPEDPLLEITPISNPAKARSYSIDWFKVLQHINTQGKSLKMFSQNPDNHTYHILAEPFKISSLYTLSPYTRLTELMNPLIYPASGPDEASSSSGTRVQKNLFGGSNPEYSMAQTTWPASKDFVPLSLTRQATTTRWGALTPARGIYAQCPLSS